MKGIRKVIFIATSKNALHSQHIPNIKSISILQFKTVTFQKVKENYFRKYKMLYNKKRKLLITFSKCFFIFFCAPSFLFHSIPNHYLILFQLSNCVTNYRAQFDLGKGNRKLGIYNIVPSAKQFEIVLFSGLLFFLIFENLQIVWYFAVFFFISFVVLPVQIIC